MNKDSAVYVAGASGMAGKAIVKALRDNGYENIITTSSSETNLTDQHEVNRFFSARRPEYVFLAAARAGGIQANISYPAEFIYNNLMIQSNVIHASHEYGIKKLLFLGSSCIFPENAMQPLKEESLFTGKPDKTYEAYAMAKLAGIKMCDAYNAQYGCNFFTVIPPNLYGPGGDYHPENSHVLQALVSKFRKATIMQSPFVEIWGTGTPRREFLHTADLADACIFLMNNYEQGDAINVGTGEDITIRELAEIIARAAGFHGELRFNTERPDGAPAKLLDVSRLHNLGWKHQRNLKDEIVNLLNQPDSVWAD